MAGLGQGILGAGAGFASMGPVGGLLGGLQGLFGGQQTDPKLEAMRQFQQGIANQQLQYARSVPGSSPDELANLAQLHGMIGQQQRSNQQRVMAGYNPSQGLPAAQMLANLGNANVAQQMAAQSGFLQDAAANRRQALLGAANTGMNAASLYKPQQSQMGQLFGQLAQAYAYRQKQQQLGAQDGTDGTNPAGVSGDLSRLGVGGAGQQVPGSNPYWGLQGGGTPPPGQGLNPFFGQQQFFQGMGDDPQMTALMMAMQQQPMQQQGPMQNPAQQQPSMTQQNVNAQTGQMAPGNEPYGLNALANQQRQSQGRAILLPGGVRLPY